MHLLVSVFSIKSLLPFTALLLTSIILYFFYVSKHIVFWLIPFLIYFYLPFILYFVFSLYLPLISYFDSHPIFLQEIPSLHYIAHSL